MLGKCTDFGGKIMNTILSILLIIFWGFFSLKGSEKVTLNDEQHALIIMQYLQERLEENTTLYLQELKQRDQDNFSKIYRLLRYSLNASSNQKDIESTLKKLKTCVFPKEYSAIYARMSLHTKQLLRSPKTMILYFESDERLSDIHIKTINGDTFLISDDYLKKANMYRKELESKGLILPKTQ